MIDTEIEKFIKDNGIPRVVMINDIASFVIAESPAAALAVNNALANDTQIADIPIATGTPQDSRLSGCIAIVTGSAQGFGKGIAEELAMKGAAITIADLNDELGNKFAEELNKKFGNGTAIFCKTNVTSSESLDQCISDTVNAFGGVDMFVSNAGVLKAGPVDVLDEAAFDFVTSVNYKAYFLCVKAVVAVFKLQNKLNSKLFMDVIQINSKSGLEGSNKNFAYAGSKFGTIGMTQSFAKELVEYNIKVNSICPGNYYDGPLWSDPERGLFVQYLKAGKVPGAKTVAEVKQFYMKQTPMNRGCLPSDVAVAICYASEQSYETGQAIPVTGGQVMLN
jgi:NAD(P)-dependent dehydrogenase (short-subunit alcohol dehydrogenase family)